MALVTSTEHHGGITITAYRDAPPEVEYGPDDNGHGGWLMTGAELVAATTAYLAALNAWLEQQATRHE